MLNVCFHSSVNVVLFAIPPAPGINFPPTVFDSTDITSFHSPVHEGSVDVDEIDEDLKDEAVLDEDDDDDGFRAVAAK